MNRMWLAALAGATVGFDARARDNRFDFVLSNVISPEQPSATVELWTTFDADQYALAGAAFDVIGDADPGGFSNPERMVKGPGTYNGDVSPDGDSVLGIIAGQIGWIGGIFVDTANPILVWRATWSTADFSPRTVNLGTVTMKYDLYLNEDLDGDGLVDGRSASFLDSLIEGSGAIQVVPAPGTAALAACALAAIRRGRRERKAR